VEQFVSDNSGASVRIVTPTPQRFVTALTRLGTRPHVDDDGAITVSDMSAAAVGELASAQELTVHELTPVRASLEDAFMELTSDSVDYRAQQLVHAH
jgi:ABC-2 type transport system ATP-binding protein